MLGHGGLKAPKADAEFRKPRRETFARALFRANEKKLAMVPYLLRVDPRAFSSSRKAMMVSSGVRKPTVAVPR